MRVAYVNARFRRDFHDGSNAHVRQFVTHAVALGHELWMEPEHAHPLASPLPRLFAPRLWRMQSMDAIYVRLEQAPPRIARWTARVHRWGPGNPLLVLEFNTVPEYGQYFGASPGQVRMQIERFRRLGGSCDLAVCVSRTLAQYVQEVLGISRTIVVPNGSDPDHIRPDAPSEPRMAPFAQAFNVAWFGSAFIGWQNLELLFAAARRLNDRGHFNIHFHLLGLGTESLNPLPPNVHVHGMVDYERLPRWLSAMHAGLCLYRPGPADFGSPLKLFDCLMGGLCVVATDHPQSREVLEQLGQAQQLVPPDDPDRLADTVERLAADPKRTRELGRRGRAFAAARHTWRRAVTTVFTELQQHRNTTM